MTNEKIIHKNKEPPRSLSQKIYRFIEGEKLSKPQAKKRKNPNDLEVRALQRKHAIEGKINRPMYLYEPYSRYKRTENPDYKYYKKYSLTGTLAGVGMLVTGFASGNYSLADAGAALALTCLGYQSGHWWRKYRTDSRFEKVSGLEKKVQGPDNFDSSYPSNHAGSLSDITAEEPEKDEALYVRRTHKSFGGYSWSMHYYSLNEPHPRDFHRYSGPGTVGILLTGFLTAAVASDYIKGLEVDVPLLYATASTALTTLGHYVGFIFGKKRAKPEYKNVSELEEKVEEKD